MRYAIVMIERSEHHKPVIEIGEWEIPVYQYEYGPEKVNVVEFKTDSRPYPDAQSEFVRLGAKFGHDIESNGPKVAMVFGQGAIGVNALKRLIDSAIEAEADELAAVEDQKRAAEQAKLDEEARIEARARELAAEQAKAVEAAKVAEDAKKDEETTTPPAKKSTTLGLNK